MTIFFRTLLICFAGLLIGRVLVFPGFFDPEIPSHDDLYRYYLISQSQWNVTMWLAPRPLMIAFLHLVGAVVSEPYCLWIILSTTSVLFVTILVVLLQHTKFVEPSNVSTLLFSVVIFSLPSSWEIYQLDYGGMLSGIIGATAVYVRIRYKEDSLILSAILPLALFWLAIEMKPTFGAALLFLSLLDVYFKRDRSSIFVVFGIIVVSVLVIVKDKLLGSPFVNFDETGGIYSVQLGSIQNLAALAVYISSALPVFLLPSLGFSYYLWWRRHRNVSSAFLFPVLAVMAILPMALIPNRVLTLYSWYSSVFFLVPLLGICDKNADNVRASSKFTTWLVYGLTVIGLILVGNKSVPVSSYFRNISEYNKNVLYELNVIGANSLNWTDKKILITGLQGPYHPFRNKSFVQMRSRLTKYTLLLRRSEIGWNKHSSALGDTIYLSSLDYSIYDLFFIFDSNGRFYKILSEEDMIKIPGWWRSAVMFCAADPNVNRISYQDFENVLACFNYAGESMEVKQLVKANQFTYQLGPLGYFFLGNAHKNSGEPILAIESYKKALTFGENNHFREALNSIKAE